MPISFNLDLTKRRKAQEAQLVREREQQLFGDLTTQLLGSQLQGPPRPGGDREFGVPRALPQGVPANLIESQLTSGIPAQQQAGFASAQQLLEQERQKQLAQVQQAQQASVLEKLGQDPGLAQLATLTGTPGFQDVALPALVKSVTPQVAGADIDPVQSSSIMADGTVQLVRRSGAVEVKTPEQANVDKIKSAQRFGAEMQGLRAGERGAAKTAIDAAADAWKGLATSRKTIASYDEGISLIDQGAGVGAIESRFPSFKAASKSLDNLQARMGLDVIQNTTFGSLSTEELKFALSTALPQGLNSAELRKWMVDKRTVQDKLSTYLEKAAIFLGTPGNNIADFLRQQRTAVFTQGAGPSGFTPGVPTDGIPGLGGIPAAAPPPPPGFN